MAMHSKRFLTCDDINLTGHSNVIRLMLFLGNARERHGYTCNSVIPGISFKSSHCISFIMLLRANVRHVFQLHNAIEENKYFSHKKIMK